MSEQQALTEEFYTTASKHMRRLGVSLDVMLLKYATIQRYKLDDAAAKRETTETLYRCAIDKLKAVSEPAASSQVNLNESLNVSVERIFDTILNEGQAENIPTTAPQELSTISLQLLRNIEALDTKKFLNWDDRVNTDGVEAYRNNATALAAFTLKSADRLREALKETTGNVTTSQPVSPSRPIQLKQGAGAPTT
jgi:hypothetical protein